MPNVSQPKGIEIFWIVMLSNYSNEKEKPQNLAKFKSFYHRFIRLVSEKSVQNLKEGLKEIYLKRVLK